MNLSTNQIQPKSSQTKRKTEQDGDGCRKSRHESVKKDQAQGQGHQTEETQDGGSKSGHQPTIDELHRRSSSERPVKDSQEDKVVVTINKDGLMLRVLLSDRVPYMCPLCGWTFTHAASLKQHGKDIHGYEEAEKMQNGGRGNEVR